MYMMGFYEYDLEPEIIPFRSILSSPVSFWWPIWRNVILAISCYIMLYHAISCYIMLYLYPHFISFQGVYVRRYKIMFWWLTLASLNLSICPASVFSMPEGVVVVLPLLPRAPSWIHPRSCSHHRLLKSPIHPRVNESTGTTKMGSFKGPNDQMSWLWFPINGCNQVETLQNQGELHVTFWIALIWFTCRRPHPSMLHHLLFGKSLCHRLAAVLASDKFVKYIMWMRKNPKARTNHSYTELIADVVFLQLICLSFAVPNTKNQKVAKVKCQWTHTTIDFQRSISHTKREVELNLRIKYSTKTNPFKEFVTSNLDKLLLKLVALLLGELWVYWYWYNPIHIYIYIYNTVQAR